MTGRLRSWLEGLSRRERVMVLAASALAAVVMLVYGIILPVGTAFDAARERDWAAIQRSGRLLVGLEQLKGPARASAGATGPVDQQVSISAEAAGFVLQSNQSRGGDATAIVVASTRAGAVMGWLDTLASQGLVVDQLTLTPSADGSVAVSATLRRPGP